MRHYRWICLISLRVFPLRSLKGRGSGVCVECTDFHIEASRVISGDRQHWCWMKGNKLLDLLCLPQRTSSPMALWLGGHWGIPTRMISHSCLFPLLQLWWSVLSSSTTSFNLDENARLLPISLALFVLMPLFLYTLASECSTHWELFLWTWMLRRSLFFSAL